jgi:cyclic pyranopterin phosphate synthase
VALVDVILGYDCNLACDYCTITPEMRARELSSRAVLQALERGRLQGYDEVSFTGGEPTLRRDLVALVRQARRIGYGHVKLQSNGLLLAHGPNVDRLIEAGVTRFNVSIHTHDADHYDRLVRRAGSYALMVAAVDNLVARQVPLTIDVILKSDTYRQLPDAIRWLRDRGVRSVHLWFVSLTDNNADNVGSLPRMTDVVPSMHQAFAWGREHDMEVRSLHVPRCLLGSDHPHAFDPGAMRVLVVTPDATFELRDSRLAGQVHVPACRGCEFEPVCPGVRPDYLARFGDVEIAGARGAPSAASARHTLPVIL